MRKFSLPLFLFLPLSVLTRLDPDSPQHEITLLHNRTASLIDSKHHEDLNLTFDKEPVDFPDDYAEYQSDAGVHSDPQFPVYSNWQRADDEGGNFRINSPRKSDNDGERETETKDAEKDQNGYISVKLPDDVLQHFGKHYGIRKDDQISSILGIPADHLPRLESDTNRGGKSSSNNKNTSRPNKQQEDTSSSSANSNRNRNTNNRKQESLPTTQKSPTLYDYHDLYPSQEDKFPSQDSDSSHDQEFYSKKELLPKLTKTKDKTEPGIEPGAAVDTSNSNVSRKRSLWSVAWQAHIYFSGSLFVLLAIYCCINVCRLHVFSRLFSRGYFLSLNLSMITIGSARGVFLLWDAYNEGGSLPPPLAYLLLNVGNPCITSAFAILFLALLRVTQVELLSPSVQTPRALAIFCVIHLSLSLALDITVGLVAKLQYLLLLGQGIFIVWSLLLSAGYFYIYSTMKKVVNRQHYDSRSVYPKLMYDPALSAPGAVGSAGGYAMRLAAGSHPPTGSANPLARAVNLTLGVALLGSLIGGVQLYGMIGMHGLLRSDPRDIPDPWYGYQVALRVLEVMICYLLAVVATTPLRQDSGVRSHSGPCSSCSPLLCCNGEGSCQKCGGVGEGGGPGGVSHHHHHHAHHLEEEIYSEINQQAVRHMLNDTGANSVDLMTTLPIGATLNQSLAMSASGQQLTNNTLLRKRGANAALTRNSQMSADSNATVDSALYSNLRSRPSSMLFNDSGFVRFRLGNDPTALSGGQTAAEQELLGSVEADRTADGSTPAGVVSGSHQQLLLLQQRESFKGSRSFDEGILSDIRKACPDSRGSPLERPQSNLSYVFGAGRGPGGGDRQIKSELCSPDVEGLPGLPQRPASKLATHSNTANNNNSSSSSNNNGRGLPESDTDVGEQYEAPAGLLLPETTKSLAAQVRSVIGYSESDLSSLDPVYAAGKSLYGYSRAPSRCSSISATQSFDMRVYGRTGFSAGGAATLGRPPPKPKLDNKFYYYGSTRGQKKPTTSQGGKEGAGAGLTPRPLLPSQRVLGGETRLGPSPTPPKAAPSAVHNTPSQSVFDQQLQAVGGSSGNLPGGAFQRSRSLGREAANQIAYNMPPRHPGSRTPTSVARKVLESVTKRRNKEKNRARQHLEALQQQQMQQQQLQQLLGPGPIIQTADGRLMALAPGTTLVEVGSLQQQDPRILVSRARQISQDRDEMLYGSREPYTGAQGNYNSRAIYERLPFGTRLQGEVRQVVGTPPSSRAIRSEGRSWQEDRVPSHQQVGAGELQQLMFDSQQQPQQQQQYQHQADRRYDDHRLAYTDQFELAADHSYRDVERSAVRLGDQQAARLAGNLASPPWRGRRLEEADSDLQSSLDQSQHRGFADSELDSEISSLFSYGREVPNLHLMSPLEYAAMLKQQYTEPSGILGKDITPDSGVVMESRQHSRERDARSRREHFLQARARERGDRINNTASTSDTSSGPEEEETSSSREERTSEKKVYTRVPVAEEGESQSQPMAEETAAASGVNGAAALEAPDTEQPLRQRKNSQQSNQTDSDPVSYEFSADSLLSDSDKESNAAASRSSELPAAVKISSVCNEIKARFLQPDP